MGILASSEGSYIAYFGLILVIPFLIGVAILVRSRGDSFARYAGLLTLKPLIATPCWWSIVAASPINLAGNCIGAPLPALILTGLIVVTVGEEPLSDSATKRSARVLLWLDTVRWLSSLAFLIAANSQSFNLVLLLIILIASMMPIVFAVVAFALVMIERVSKPIPKSEPVHESFTAFSQRVSGVIAFVQVMIEGASKRITNDEPTDESYIPVDQAEVYTSYVADEFWHDSWEYNGEKLEKRKVFVPPPKRKRGEGDILIDLPKPRVKRKNDEA